MNKKSVFVYFFISLFASAIMLIGCGEDTTTVAPPVVVLSDLTRTGEFISFTSDKDGNYDIFLAQVNTSGLLDTAFVYPSNPFNLTQSNSSNDMMSNWSPDGRVLVFTRVDGASQEVYAYFFDSTGRIDTNIASNPARLFSSGGNWDNNPSFSPDGLYLIWDRRTDQSSPPNGVDGDDSRDLYIGDVAGSGNSFAVTNLRAIQTTSGPDEYNPKWAPRISIRRVAYEYQSSATSTDHDVYVIDPLDPPNNVNFYNPNNSGYPAWAPACDRIVFESDKNPGDYWSVVGLSYPASGSPTDVVNETAVNSRYPTWLPNGGLLAYIRYTGANGNIYIVSTGGGTTYKLLQTQPQFDAANNLWPAW